MGLTASSTGRQAADGGLPVIKKSPGERVIALAGNPNVGKSTVFNQLTGMNQHTGNWPGKTVSNAQGTCVYHGESYIFVDIPGTYSLMAHSAEEEVARDFLCFGQPDGVVVVCDATCLERNLNLVLQTMEITPRVVVCVNLLDEARKKHIRLDLDLLSQSLGVPVVGASARSRQGLDNLMDKVAALRKQPPTPAPIRYTPAIEEALALIEPRLAPLLDGRLSSRWTALRLLEGDPTLARTMARYLGADPMDDPAVAAAVEQARCHLKDRGLPPGRFREALVSCIVRQAERISAGVVKQEKKGYRDQDRRIDRILTGKATGIPVMILLLLVVFWITIVGANYPSDWLAAGLFWVEDRLAGGMAYIGAPAWLTGALVHGMYRVLAWVVSVMLPPMAIFFPLFTLLEDVGYLPRIAFNLDKHFQKARTCGKQALTMCMGFGCNAAGVVGCRIIDSPRERLIATITNNFAPCNGRFPTLIAIITMFFVGVGGGAGKSALSALFLTGVIVLGVAMTLLISRLLSQTILKGIPSSFTLELPPYRTPQIGQVIVRSVVDRTLFVLGRAASVAAPAGLLLWIMANVTVGDASLLAHCSSFLDPFARLFGLDGTILMAFILGFPANEIVFPIIIMAYMAQDSLTEMSDLSALRTLLVDNGWTWLTAVCTMLFSVMHWPCSTTCLTIRKETGSAKWTLVSFLVPTLTGLAVCFVTACVGRLFL